MPFIKAGHDRGSKESDGRPTQHPTHVTSAHRGQSCAPRAEKQNAEDGVADDVAPFANEEVPVFEVQVVQAEKVMQQRIQNSAGVGGGGEICGFDRNDDEPQNRGDPRLQKIFSVGVQTGALLDGIVGGLAGDHDIMNVTLAQSGAADANESGLLQELCDSRAAAIAHA
jgi:hypothetical protein